MTAYSVRGLQLLLGSSKRAITERAEEMGRENDSIPLAEIVGQGDTRDTSRTQSSLTIDIPVGTSTEVFNGLPSPPRTPVLKNINSSILEQASQIPAASLNNQSSENSSHLPLPLPPQEPPSLTRPQKWAAFINLNIDRITWSTIFLFVGLPIYYTTGYAMPAQLTVNIMAYFAAISLPLKWRQFLHPVLVSSLITVLTIWVFGLIRHDSLDQVLDVYKTGSKYTQLWHGGDPPKPGAADVFDSVLDASIIALALPMFQYRKELFQHFFAIVIPNIAISVASLFGYPALCYAIGISSKRSLSFAARSLTLALATPSVTNLGGDLNTVAALCIMSGIVGVLIGPKLLLWLRIPEGKTSCSNSTICYMIVEISRASLI